MSRKILSVRTVRPHDTTTGLKQPGEEYERSEADAQQLIEGGIVEAVKPKAAAKRK